MRERPDFTSEQERKIDLLVDQGVDNYGGAHERVADSRRAANKTGAVVVRTAISLAGYYGWDSKPRRERQRHDWEDERMEAIAANIPVDPEQAMLMREQSERQRADQLKDKIERATSREAVNLLLAKERTRLEQAGKVYDYKDITRDIESPFL